MGRVDDQRDDVTHNLSNVLLEKGFHRPLTFRALLFCVVVFFHALSLIAAVMFSLGVRLLLLKSAVRLLPNAPSILV